MLDVFDATPGQNEPIWQDEPVAVPKFPVEREPREDFGDVFGRKVVQNAAIDQLAEDQPVVVEDFGEHVGLLRGVATVQISEAVQDIPDATNDIPQLFFFEVDSPTQRLLQRCSLLVETSRLRE